MDWSGRDRNRLLTWPLSVTTVAFLVPLQFTVVFHTASKAGLWPVTLRWRHNGLDGVSNHQPHDCLLNLLSRCRSKKPSKLHVTGLCEGNSPVTGEFPAQMASNAENVTIWWRHHETRKAICRMIVFTSNMYCSEATVIRVWYEGEAWASSFLYMYTVVC